jgi:hypothetical protein
VAASSKVRHGIVGLEPHDAGPDDAGPIIPVAPKTPPFGWVGVIGTGQSLAVGGGGSQQQLPISKTASAKNLKLVDTGATRTWRMARR